MSKTRYFIVPEYVMREGMYVTRFAVVGVYNKLAIKRLHGGMTLKQARKSRRDYQRAAEGRG